ncbi:hypothetical protein AB1Y20_019277 [Prymnesium parvum]|uniref:VPS9 domain-containing protein n=1 Tax=Prymnesium parvum TaxID=97485 RepID=A0AB34JTX9_PRYPA
MGAHTSLPASPAALPSGCDTAPSHDRAYPEAARVADCPTGISVSSVTIAGGVAFVGTADGSILSFLAASQWPDAAPLARHPVHEGAPVLQLQALPHGELLLRLCAGQVSAHAVSSLQPVAHLHPSRATRFHCDAEAPLAGLCVCAGRSLLWKYDLATPPALRWSRLLLQRTLAAHLTKDLLVAVTPRVCLVLSAETGETLLSCALPSLGAGVPAEWPDARIVRSAELKQLQVVPIVPSAAEAHRLWPASRATAGQAVVVTLDHPAALMSVPLELPFPPLDVAGGLFGLFFLTTDAIHLLPPQLTDGHTDSASARGGHAREPPRRIPLPVRAQGASCMQLCGLQLVVRCGHTLHRVPITSTGAADELHRAVLEAVRCNDAAARRSALDGLGARLLGCTDHPLGAALARWHDALLDERQGERMLRRAGGACDALALALADERAGQTPPLEGGGRGEGAQIGGEAEAAEAVAEHLVYESVYPPLLEVLAREHAEEEAKLMRGATLLLRRGFAACGITQARADVLVSPGGKGASCRRWVGLLCTSPLPSEKLEMCAKLCDTITSVHGDELSAEELISLVSYTLAVAIDCGIAPKLTANLKMAQSRLPTTSAKSKLGYCFITIQAALQVVTNQVHTADIYALGASGLGWNPDHTPEL